MKTTDIITTNPMTITTRTFKNPELTKATQRITAIYNDAAKYADSKNREIAKILGEIAEKKSYEADGFKSVADYASTIFGIAKNNAYSLANAGKVYNDPKAHPELKSMSPSKIAELASLDTNTVTEALNSGEISHETTQKALREFAEKSRESATSEKPKVLDTYTARPCIPIISDEQQDTFSSNKTLDEWDDWFMGYVANVSPESSVEIIKLPKGKVAPDDNKATLNRRLYLNRSFSIVVEFLTYTTPKPSKKTPKYTREQLQAMLAELDATAESK